MGDQVDRNIGIDVARGLALIGMIIAHLAPPPGMAVQLFDGPPSALFAVVAGATLHMMTASAIRVGGVLWLQRRHEVVMRGLIIFTVGCLLIIVSGPIYVVLPAMGLGMALSVQVLSWSVKYLALLWCGLTAAAGVMEVLTPLVPNEEPSVLFLFPYPLLPWLAFMVTGVVFMRVQPGWLFGGGALLIACGGLALRETVTDGMFAATAHGNGIINTISCSAFGVFVLVAVRRAGRWAFPIQAMGQMSLSLYVLHVFTGPVTMLLSGKDSDPVVAVETIIVFMVLAMVIISSRQRGPLEHALRRAIKRSSSLAISARP